MKRHMRRLQVHVSAEERAAIDAACAKTGQTIQDLCHTLLKNGGLAKLVAHHRRRTKMKMAG